MRRTNCKEVNEIIKNYLMEGFQNWHEENKGYFDNELTWLETMDTTNYSQVCSAILDVLHVEKIKHDTRKNCGLYYYFEDWVSGLCSVIDTNYYCTVSAVDLLGTWLDQTENEKAKYDERKAEETITRILFREITRHAER